MIELLGSIVELVFDVVGLTLTLVFDVFEFILAFFGGLVSLFFSLMGVALIAALIGIFIHRRRKKKEPKQHIYVDNDGEEFISYYDQQQ